ncbi:MAG: hypothetical protein ABW277_03120 [Longimicrobiaceae bacterium]
MSNNSDHVAATLDLTNRLTSWLRSAGVKDSEMAVDFADILSAARHIEEILTQLLTVEPTRPEGADEALSHLGKLHVWLFGEMKHHLLELEDVWPRLENRLVELAPKDE